MSKFLGRRFITTGTGLPDGYNDHGLLIGLEDDDHLQYLITSAIRVEDFPTSGIQKTGFDDGDVFTLINAGSGSALFIQQTGTVSATDAALDIDNTGNTGRALSIFSSAKDPDLPLTQIVVSETTFDEPIVSIEHADPCGLALQVLGDAYIACQLEVGEALILECLPASPFELGKSGIYIKGDPGEAGEFFFVDKFGDERTFTVDTVGTGDGIVNIEEGLHIEIGDSDGDGYQEISVDTQSLAGRGLIVVPTADGQSNNLEVDLDLLIGEGCAIDITEDADGYKIFSVDVNALAGTGLSVEIGEDGCPRLTVGDGYGTIHVRKFGSEADNTPFNSVFSLDGYEYPIGQDRLLVWINGIAQFDPVDYKERSTTTIEFAEARDVDDVIDVIILPSALGGVIGGTTNLQSAYNNSASGAKNILENDGQITFTQTLASGSALRLISSSTSNVTPTLVVDQAGTGEGARVKSIDGTSASILIQKDTASRNTIVNTHVIERTTSHAIGALTGIGSAMLTRLEDTGGNLFSASRLVTGTEDATDSAEKTFLSFELSDDGVLTEHMRLTSTGRLGLNTSVPDALLHVQGDAYVSASLEVAGKAIVGSAGANASLNVEIFALDPPVLENGDIWLTDDGGTRELKARIGGITYAATLT